MRIVDHAIHPPKRAEELALRRMRHAVRCLRTAFAQAALRLESKLRVGLAMECRWHLGAKSEKMVRKCRTGIKMKAKLTSSTDDSLSYFLSIDNMHFVSLAVLLAGSLPAAFAATYHMSDNWVGSAFLSAFVHEAIADPTHGRV